VEVACTSPSLRPLTICRVVVAIKNTLDQLPVGSISRTHTPSLSKAPFLLAQVVLVKASTYWERLFTHLAMLTIREHRVISTDSCVHNWWYVKSELHRICQDMTPSQQMYGSSFRCHVGHTGVEHLLTSPFPK
jgi:hypothetical protein